jgi:hypothetical protein
VPGVFYGAVLHDTSSSSTISTNARLRRARVTRAMPGDGDRREYNEVPIGDRTSTPQCWRTGEGAEEGQQGQGRGAVLPPLPEVLHRAPRVLLLRLLFHSTCPGGGPRSSCASSRVRGGGWAAGSGLLRDEGEDERAQGGPRRFAKSKGPVSIAVDASGIESRSTTEGTGSGGSGR